MKSFNHQLVFGLFAHVALLVGPATAQGIYYSLQGEFVSCGDEQQLFFDVTDGIASFEEVRMRTYHSSGTLGGSNLAADVVSAGGFNPTLRLEEGDGTFVEFNDDLVAAFLLDAQIVRTVLPDEGNSYRMDLKASGGDLGGLDGSWALDLSGGADSDLELVGSKNSSNDSSITSLKFGTSGTGVAQVIVSTGQSLVVDAPSTPATRAPGGWA